MRTGYLTIALICLACLVACAPPPIMLGSWSGTHNDDYYLPYGRIIEDPSGCEAAGGRWYVDNTGDGACWFPRPD